MGKPWELKEIKVLQKFVDIKTCKEIGKLLNRPEGAVIKMYQKIGLKKVYVNVDFWTTKETELLARFYATTKSKDIALLIPDKSIEQISDKAYKIGLRKIGRKHKTKRNEKTVDDCRS